MSSIVVNGADGLDTLVCNEVGIGSLDVSALEKLTTLSCNLNPDMETISVNGAGALLNIECNQTGVSSLDVSELEKLEKLSCEKTDG